MISLKCERCQHEGVPELERSGPHTKASCSKCGGYIKFVSKRELEDTTLEAYDLEEDPKSLKELAKTDEPVEGKDYESLGDEDEGLPW